MADVWYTVVRGDNLSRIANRFGTTVSNIAHLNNIRNVNLIYAGQHLLISRDGGSTTPVPVPTVNTVSKPTIIHFGLQADTDRTVFATWAWDKSNTDSYKVKWKYLTENKLWFVGNDGTVDGDPDTDKESIYTAPDNAIQVKFTVKPVSEKYTVNNVETSYWTGTWSTEETYDFRDNPPVTPPVPSVSITNYVLKASLDNLNVNADSIQFKVVQDDATIFNIADTTIKEETNSAIYTCTVTPGFSYKVACRSARDGTYSAWSNYSSAVETPPSPPSGITICRANSETSVYLEWPAVGTATSYDIEYATKREYFDGSNQTSTQTGIEFTHYELTGLDTGSEYFFRVRAVNNVGRSAWTGIRSTALGKEPVAPTTWSSTTTAVVGEPLNLYWVHNAEDGSSQTYAEVELIIDGVGEVHTIRNYYLVNYDPTTGVYTATETFFDPTGLNGTIVEGAATTTGEVVYTATKSDGTQVYYCTRSDVNDGENRTRTYSIDTTKYNEGTTIQWRVRTAGVTKVYGEWSIQRTVDIYAPPTISLNIKDASGNVVQTLTSFPLYVSALTGPNTQAPIGYHLTVKSNEIYETVDNVGNVKMVNAGEEVYSKYFDITTALLVKLSADNIDLENNIEYTVTCSATMNSGLTVDGSSTLTVSWTDVSYEPNVEIGVDPDTLAANIRPYCVNETGALVQGVTLSVYRREFDGSFTEIISGIENAENIFVTDPHPALDFARYRIVATTTETGAVSYYDSPGYPVGEKAVIIQWDEKWSSFEADTDEVLDQPAWSGSLLRLPYNIDISDSYGADVSLIEYIGRKRPVSYYGTQLGETSTWNVEIDKADKETLYALRRLAIWMGDVYVREPSGSGYWANIVVSFGQKHCEVTIPVTLDITRVEGGM